MIFILWADRWALLAPLVASVRFVSGSLRLLWYLHRAHILGSQGVLYQLISLRSRLILPLRPTAHEIVSRRFRRRIRHHHLLICEFGLDSVYLLDVFLEAQIPPRRRLLAFPVMLSYSFVSTVYELPLSLQLIGIVEALDLVAAREAILWFHDVNQWLRHVPESRRDETVVKLLL